MADVAVWRGWLRVILGLSAAAALASVPAWWDAAAAAVAAGPLAPAWPWLVPGLFGAVVTVVTLLAPLPLRRRRVELRVERFEHSFLRRLAATAGAVDPGGWRRELAGQRQGAAERLAGRTGHRKRRARQADSLLGQRWQHITAAVAERARGQTGPSSPGVIVADLVDAALRDASGAPPQADTETLDPPPPVAPEDPGRRQSATAVPAPARPEPLHPQSGEGAELGPEPASDRPGVAVRVYDADAFAAAVQQARESVAVEGGVYRVRERLYGRGAEPRGSLRRNAEGVITDDKIARLETAGRRREVRIPVAGDGLRYDQLLAQFPDPESSATRTRVLEQQRVALAADAAVLLVSRAAGYEAALVAGAASVSGSSASALGEIALTAGDTLYDDYLQGRRYLLAPPGSDATAALPVAGDQVALLPVTLDGRRAYLLFAVGGQRDRSGDETDPWSRETLIERLNLHP